MDNSLSLQVQQMRFRDFLLLEKIADLGSLRRVAEAMHITQPAITHSLKGLEQAFGIALVERGRGGACLTAAGQAVLTRVRAASHELQQAHRAALDCASPLLRVGSSPAAMLNLVPQAIAMLRQQAPLTRVVLSERGVEMLWSQLDEGSFDAIVTRLPNTGGASLPEGLTFSKIGHQKMVLVCASAHPAATRRMSPADLAACEWVFPPADSLALRMLNEWFAQAGVRPPAPRIVCRSFYAGLQLVARSDLLMIASETAVQALQPSLKVKIMTSSWNESYLDIVVACRSASLDNPAIQVLWSCFGASPAAKVSKASKP